MDFLETFLVIFLSSVAARIAGLLFFKGADKEAKKNANSEHITVKNSPIFIAAGILVMAFGVGMGILAKSGILIGTVISNVLFVLFFALIGLCYIVYGLALRIVIDKSSDYITFRSINRKQRKIYYKDIDYYIERKNGNIDFFVNGKKYHVYKFAYNFDALIREFGQRHVKKIHRNQLSADGKIKNRNQGQSKEQTQGNTEDGSLS